MKRDTVVGSVQFNDAKPWHPPVLNPEPLILPAATEKQLDEIAADYAQTMRARGFTIGDPELAAIRRMATIQDAWRCAFCRVIGS
jgi:hypothetical protein